MIAAFICGLSYFFVYNLDFAHIFPKSPNAMPQLLILLEALGIAFSIPLMILSFNKIKELKENKSKLQLSQKMYGLITLAIIIGTIIIIFATKSAMTEK